MASLQTIEIPVQGMDCAECTQHVQHAISALPGVEMVNVFLAAEKAVVRLDPVRVDMASIRQAVESAGYTVPASVADHPAARPLGDFTRRVLTLFGIVFGAVLFVAVIGEWVGLFEALTRRVPWPVGLVLVLAGGYPVFRNVVRAALKGQVISHTLMSLGEEAAQAPIAEPPQAVVLLLAVGMGATAGAALSFAQWLVLRKAVPRAGWWIPANMLAWMGGMPVIFWGIDAAQKGQPPLESFLLMAATLLLAGAVVGAINGTFLAGLAKRPTADHGAGVGEIAESMK